MAREVETAKVRGLRLILFDRTCVGRAGLGLSRAWSSGSRLYALLGRSDGARGVSTFEEGLGWLTAFRATEPIAEVQFWGHGKWGRIFVDREPLDRTAFIEGHTHHRAMCALRDRLSPGALVWFRTCETFGAVAGQDFAQAWTDFFGCRAAGHTFVIGYWQSGLHLLDSGQRPTWSSAEGLHEGTAAEPQRAALSWPGRPNTITCWQGHVPEGW
jgi:hypothetical protein